MRVVIAPDKFKGTLSASEVIAALSSGIESARPGAEIFGVPMADGGEGTLDAALAAGFEERRVTVTGPLGDPVQTSFGKRGSVALVEMAQASGLELVPESRRDPLRATSFGTGELIGAALDALGADSEETVDIVLAIGGSASTDGGAGLLQALGATLLDARGDPIAPGGVGLLDLARLDLAGLDPRLARANLTLATDVTNPLLGSRGAAAVFAPQKGADRDHVRELERGLENWVDVLAAEIGPDARGAAERPGAGAAGGVGFAVMAVLGVLARSVSVRPGVDVVRELTGLDAQLAQADLVITGEGSLDGQSLSGKTPIGVARAARSLNPGVPVLAVCGRNALTDEQSRTAGFGEVYALADRASETDALSNPVPLLKSIGADIARQKS